MAHAVGWSTRSFEENGIPFAKGINILDSSSALKNRKLDQSCTSNPKSEVSDWTSNCIPRRRMPANPGKAQVTLWRTYYSGRQINFHELMRAAICLSS